MGSRIMETSFIRKKSLPESKFAGRMVPEDPAGLEQEPQENKGLFG